MNKQFRNRASAPRLAPDQAERQGRVSRLAFEALRRPDAVIAFLNTHHPLLGGRPIDLAIADENGLRAVARTIADLKPANPTA